MSSKAIISSVVFCLLAVFFGAGLYLIISGFDQPVSDDPVISVYSVILSAVLCSIFFWWLLLVRRQHYSWQRGAVAGGLTGLFAHPLAFILPAYYSLIRYGPPEGSWLETSLLAPLLGVLLAAFSLLIFGWVTVPLGAVVGGLLGKLFQNR